MRYEPLFNYPIVLAIKDRGEGETTDFASYCVYPPPIAPEHPGAAALRCELSGGQVGSILESAEADNIWTPLHDALEMAGAAGVNIIITAKRAGAA